MNPQRKTKFGLLAAAGLVAILAIFIPSHQAHAWFGIGDIAAGVVGYVAFAFLYIVATLVGLFIAIETYLIAVVLQLSGNIVNTVAVQSGFAVTLAVANLGFVLGIIIIAIATILRRETYGIKKTLWKLVVAAILVNFSLVIGGAFISFANTITTTFLTALPGGGGDNGPLVFAEELAGAFSPQRAFLKVNDTGGIGGGIPSQSVDGDTGATIASIITPVVSVASAVVLLVVIVITLGVFQIMLLIRYVELSILLVIMPFAWLMWLFPKTSSMWSKWWNEFIRWTFFAPIVIFFLWLAIATAQKMAEASSNGGNPLAGMTYKADSNGIIGGLSATFGSFVGTFAGTALQGIIVIGLAIGGMIAANSLSITGAKNAVGALKEGGKVAGTWAVKRGARGALNTAARVTQPRARTTPGGAAYTPISPMAQRFRKWAANPNLKTKSTGRGFWGDAGGLGSSVWGGMKKGSGLFTGKTVSDWECQNCIPSGQPTAYLLRSTKKPNSGCPVCHATVAQARWLKVGA